MALIATFSKVLQEEDELQDKAMLAALQFLCSFSSEKQYPDKVGIHMIQRPQIPSQDFEKQDTVIRIISCLSNNLCAHLPLTLNHSVIRNALCSGTQEDGEMINSKRGNEVAGRSGSRP